MIMFISSNETDVCDEIHKIIEEKCIEYRRVSKGQWFVETKDGDPDSWMKKFMHLMSSDGDTRVVVIPIKQYIQGFIARSIWDWVNGRIFEK